MLATYSKMNDRNYIEAYCNKQKEKLAKHIGLCAADFTPDNIHDIRICTKKLMAIKALAFYDSSFSIKFSRKISSLFKLLGKVRDAQIQKEFTEAANEQDLYNEYIDWLDGYIAFYTQVAQKMLHSIDVCSPQKIIKTEFYGDAPKNIHILDLIHTIVYHIKERIIRKLKDKKSNKNLHEIRRLVKNLFYFVRLSNDTFPSYQPITISLEELREIEVALGNWHDKAVGVASLSKFIKRTGRKNSDLKMRYTLLKNQESAIAQKSFIESYNRVENAFRKE